MSCAHPEFVSLLDLCPGLIIEASYATPDNFTGMVVRGYRARKALLAIGPAKGLCMAQRRAESLGLTLKVFDAYRPAKAVSFFQEWAKKEETNLELKRRYYPAFERKELFERGYLAQRSGHSRGAAVDLTLTDPVTGKDLDMGCGFDCFAPISHTDSPLATEGQRRNRKLLKRTMEEAGFRNFDQEWWHYSFNPEPFPGQYFDFDVT